MSDGERLGDDSGEIVARAKLPDDLVLAEFESIVDAIDAVLLLPQDSYDPLYDYPYKERYRRRPRRDPENDLGLEVVRVQYGSDFLLVMGAAAAVLGSAYTVAKIVDKVQDIRLKNEDIHAKKAERLRRQQAERDVLRDAAREATTDVAGDEDWPWRFAPYPEPPRWFFDAVATLAWFRVRISVSPRQAKNEERDR